MLNGRPLSGTNPTLNSLSIEHDHDIAEQIMLVIISQRQN